MSEFPITTSQAEVSASGPPWFHRAHGLSIASMVELPEFIADASDVTPAIHISENRALEGDVSPYGYAGEINQFTIWWSLAGKFLISRRGDIVFSRVDKVADQLVRVPLTGCVMAIAAHMQGRFMVHANALNVGGRAILLIGKKGAGKSTMTAALLHRGHSLLSDDAVAVTFERPDEATVHLGCLQMKLWPDSMEKWAVQGAEDSHRQMHAACKKRIVSALSYASSAARVPLAGIYFLDEASSISLNTLSPDVGWRELFSQSYVALFGDALFDPASKADHFAKCALLARKVGVKLFSRPKQFTQIDQVCSLLEADVAAKEIS